MIWRALAVALVALWCWACAGEDVPGIGPTVTTSHGELVQPFLRALDRAGDELQWRGLADPALVVDVTLVEGPAFVVGEADLDGGRQLWGRNRLVLSGRGLRCEQVIALRTAAGDDLAVAEARPSATSLAHEMAHCALDTALSPDPGHEDRDVWDRIVPDVRAALAAEGL